MNKFYNEIYANEVKFGLPGQRRSSRGRLYLHADLFDFCLMQSRMFYKVYQLRDLGYFGALF